jgi:hypothetical protein
MFRTACTVVISLLIALQSMRARLGTATISGSVRDPSSAVVAGASITAVNTATGFKRETVSNALGEFNPPGLVPGVYDVSVQAQGFKRFQSTGMSLQVDQNAHLDITLEVGRVSEVVEITAQAPLVESQTASLGAVVDTQKILALPLNGRSARRGHRRRILGQRRSRRGERVSDRKGTWTGSGSSGFAASRTPLATRPFKARPASASAALPDGAMTTGCPCGGGTTRSR